MVFGTWYGFVVSKPLVSLETWPDMVRFRCTMSSKGSSLESLQGGVSLPVPLFSSECSLFFEDSIAV